MSTACSGQASSTLLTTQFARANGLLCNMFAQRHQDVKSNVITSNGSVCEGKPWHLLLTTALVIADVGQY